MTRLTPSSARMRLMSVVLAGSIGLAGCAQQTAYDNTLSPAQNQLRQANARFNQTVGEGAVAGALVGGLAGLALGGRNRAGAAAIGAGAGAALGAGAGYLVARNNLSRSSTEAQYADAIQQASADAEAYRSSASASRQIADQATADANRLRAQVRSGQLSQAQYRASLARYNDDNTILTQQISSARQLSSQMRQDSQVASGSNRQQLLQKASEVDASRAELERNQAQISRMLAGVA